MVNNYASFTRKVLHVLPSCDEKSWPRTDDQYDGVCMDKYSTGTLELERIGTMWSYEWFYEPRCFLN
jgi:hypothetical protein